MVDVSNDGGATSKSPVFCRRQHIEEALKVLNAVPSIDDTEWKSPGQHVWSAGAGMPHDDRIRLHGVEISAVSIKVSPFCRRRRYEIPHPLKAAWQPVKTHFGAG